MERNRTYTHATILVVLTALLVSCLPDGDFKTAINYEPQDAGDGWTTGDASEHGFDTGRLNDIYEIMFSESSYITSQSLLIVRNGHLVSESYFRSRDDISGKANIMGITKSVTSLIAGLAADRELIDTEHRLYRYIPGYFDGDQNKRDMTVEHVLTMKIGLEWDQDNHTINMFNTNRFPSSMRVVLTKPFESPAGTNFYYNHGAPQLIMGVARYAFGLNSTDSLVHMLFDPLGIDDFVWEQHTDGLHFGGLGLHMRPRDLARIGQFVLQKGQWDGTRIVSDEWIEKATSQRVAPGQAGFHGYGYYWWIDAENNAFYGMGEGGQYLYIVPDENLVIVHTANPSAGSGYKGIGHEDLMSLSGMILEAIR